LIPVSGESSRVVIQSRQRAVASTLGRRHASHVRLAVLGKSIDGPADLAAEAKGACWTTGSSGIVRGSAGASGEIGRDEQCDG
jgi:hypothetical protein